MHVHSWHELSLTIGIVLDVASRVEQEMNAQKQWMVPKVLKRGGDEPHQQDISVKRNMGVRMSDIGNMHVYARKTLELSFRIATASLGEEEGCHIAISIVKALYRLKMSGAAWHAFLAEDTLIRSV